MLKRILAVTAAWAALGAMQSAPTQDAKPLSLWRLDCGEFLINDYNGFFSDTWDYEPGPKRITSSCYLVRNGDEYLLWDTGVGAELVGKPNVSDAQTMSLKTRITDQLAQIGVRPDQIRYVGISHYHADHIGQAADFPKAELVMGAHDLELLKNTPPGPFIQPERLTPWLQDGGKLFSAEGDVDFFEDGRVLMLQMPGHTPGHYALLVRLASGPVLLTGDLYHFTEQVANKGVPPFNASRADTLASMDRFDRLAKNLKAKVIIQHEPADIAKLPAFPQAAQ